MKSQEDLISVLNGICQKDLRYKLDAYTFVLAGLNYTMEKLNRQGHLSGAELSQGLREYALELYGRMAKTVLEHWGVENTIDFGIIVFNMVDSGVLGKLKHLM